MENRIYLRALELNDYKISIKWRNDAEIWNMLGGVRYFVSEEYERRWVEETIINSKDIKLAICLKETNQYIGNVYLTDIDYINSSCQSHILIGEKSLWGNGYAKEAMREILSFAFLERGLNRVYAKILESNIASIKMHEKCGFKKEGIFRNAILKNGKFENQVVLSILKQEFR